MTLMFQPTHRMSIRMIRLLLRQPTQCSLQSESKVPRFHCILGHSSQVTRQYLPIIILIDKFESWYQTVSRRVSRLITSCNKPGDELTCRGITDRGFIVRDLQTRSSWPVPTLRQMKRETNTSKISHFATLQSCTSIPYPAFSHN